MVGPVRVGAIAAGGHCVARLDDGRVVFVRHALPGELVRLRLTDTSRDRLWYADAVDIIEASDDRVEAPCPIAGPGGCGGCDFQHVAQPAQRELKRAVVAEQLQRLAGIAWDGAVEDCGHPFGWRTRMRYVRTDDGRLGMRRHRSGESIALPPEGCRIASPRTKLDLAGLGESGEEVVVAGAGSGASAVAGERVRGANPVTETAVGRDFEVWADGFWQVHPAAPATLSTAVLEGLQPRPGERAWDLFCGVGLFTAALVGAGCQVAGIEGSRRAVAQARRNVPEARFWAGDVLRTLRRLPRPVDLIVLDPPRAGAGKALMRSLVEARPRALAYVSCDPATLARDLGAAQNAGARVASVRAFDLFPQTQHVECVALLELSEEDA